jgi:hypothetical protein
MSRRQLDQDLAAVRALVADGRDRLGESTGDLDQFWLNSARTRLATVDDFLISAAGGLGPWARTLIGAGALVAGAAVTALAGSALGFSTFWIVVCSWAVGAVAEIVVRRRVAKAAPAFGRRRLARFVPPAAPRSGPRPRPRPRHELAELPADLVKARVRLVSSTLRVAGPKHWRPAYLARAAAEEPAVFWLAEADTLLCQAIDHLEQYLAADTKEPT